MHPPDCPKWNYETPANSPVLAARNAALIRDVRGGQIDVPTAVGDTRRTHERLLRGLTPPACDYYAGHYRGEGYRCLRYCKVTVPANPAVGWDPPTIPFVMAEMVRPRAVTLLKDLDLLFSLPEAQLPADEKLACAVRCVCALFALVQLVHPYVDGNGHAGRFILWATLGRYGYWLQGLPIEPS